MDRPHGTTDRVVADAARRSAAEHAQRVAHLARRRAGARRRALLTAVLLVAAVAGWSAVAATGATVLLGAVPTLGLVGVLGLGRAAVRSAERADAQWAAGAATRLPLAAATAGARTVGRAVRPSDARTEVMARVPGRATAAQTAASRTAASPATASPTTAAQTGQPAVARGAHTEPREAAVPRQARRVVVPDVLPTQRPEPAAEAAEQSAPREVAGPTPQRTSAWSPVPVPPPSYTLKPSAPRREPAPLPADEHLATPAAAAPAAGQDDHGAVTPPARPAADGTASLDLDAILARRRASGE
jgi:hypothetical protein